MKLDRVDLVELVLFALRSTSKSARTTASRVGARLKDPEVDALLVQLAEEATRKFKARAERRREVWVRRKAEDLMMREERLHRLHRELGMAADDE